MIMAGLLWNFRRPVCASDWARFDFYARRVKVMYFYSYGEKFAEKAQLLRRELSPSVYDSLACRRTSDPLCPNLQNIYWDVSDLVWSASLPLPTLFLHPGLRAIHMYHRLRPFGNPMLQLACSFISYVPQFACDIEEMHVNFDGPRGWSDFLHASLPSLRSLRILDIKGTSQSGAQKIIMEASRLPFLRSLSIATYDYTGVSAENVPPLQATVFTTLEVLELKYAMAPSLTSMFRSYQFPKLKSFSLTLVEDTIPASKDILHLIASYLPNHILQHLSVKVISPINAAMDVFPIRVFSPIDIQPIFSFRNLISLNIGCIEVKLSDSDIMRLAMAFPRLQQIRMRSDICLTSIIHFVRHCPDLEDLNIFPLATSYIPITADRLPGDGLFNEKIKTLNVLDTHLRDLPGVAAFLSDIFPNLTSVEPQLLQEMVEIFKAVRMQERRAEQGRRHL
ncbi:unnamed protein product [Somion occarium]|uniref:F-box domain-containing protein n=1 Tax=Somion occarium TaxID=3059160 RepID=A0ABP1CQX3_9APHY